MLTRRPDQTSDSTVKRMQPPHSCLMCCVVLRLLMHLLVCMTVHNLGKAVSVVSECSDDDCTVGKVEVL